MENSWFFWKNTPTNPAIEVKLLANLVIQKQIIVPHSGFCIQQTFVHIHLLSTSPKGARAAIQKSSKWVEGCHKVLGTLGSKIHGAK